MKELEGRTALITGASKGIGAAIADSLAAAGARVGVNYSSDRAGAQAVVDRIHSSGGVATTVGGSVSDETAMQRMFDQLRDAYGPVDILINNAGIWHFQPITDVTIDEYHRHYDTNVLGTVLASRTFAQQTDVTGGAIVTISSSGALGPTGPGISLYAGTKAAVATMTRVLANELAPRGIRANTVAAGLIDTEGTRASGFVGSQAYNDLVATIPLGRAGRPEDIASVATFLAGPGAAYLTGETIYVDGGIAA